MFVMSMSCVSFADSLTEIGSVTLELYYDTFKAKESHSADDINVVPDSGTGYDISSTKLNKSKYQEGDSPEFTVVLKADDNHCFAKNAYYKENIHVFNGEAYNASLSSSRKTLTIKIYLNDVEEAEDPGWDPQPTPGGGGGPGHDVPVDSGPGAQDQSGKGAWLQDPFNGRWWYSLPTGSRPKSQWLQIDKKWYWFDELGYMGQNAWLNYQGKWYFVGPEGDMWISRRTPDRFWVGSDGAWDGKPASY